MSPHGKTPGTLPEPRQIDRRLRIGPWHFSGLVFFALIPLLAATGVLHDAGEARDTIWRVTFIYVFVMLAFRLTGKREVGQMSPLELVTLMMIPEIFSTAVNRNNSSLSLATVGVATLFLVVFVTGLLKFRSRTAEALLEGEPTILVHDGEYLEGNMRRERVTPEEICAEMRLAGVERLEDVRWAILETEGKISVIPRGTRTLSPTKAASD